MQSIFFIVKSINENCNLAFHDSFKYKWNKYWLITFKLQYPYSKLDPFLVGYEGTYVIISQLNSSFYILSFIQFNSSYILACNNLKWFNFNHIWNKPQKFGQRCDSGLISLINSLMSLIGGLIGLISGLIGPIRVYLV